MFTEINPDKGTETILNQMGIGPKNTLFTEINPDKGTETVCSEDICICKFIVYRN